MMTLSKIRSCTLLIMTVLFSFTLQSFDTDTNPNLFFDGTYESAKAKAGEEGKLFLVDFYANWCTPCKWMEKTTFQNDKIRSILGEDYVSLKIDIDQAEGYNLKEKFGVSMLPTILIFNSQGKMVERIEKTLTAESLNSILSFHNHSANKVIQKHYLNTSPRSTITDAPPQAIDQSLSDLYKNYQESQERKSVYRVQIGHYSNYESAFEKVNELRDQFFEPIIVLNDYQNGNTIYKLMMGDFKTMDEAESFRLILKNEYNIDGIVY